MSEIPSADYNTEFTQGSIKAALSVTSPGPNPLRSVPIDEIIVRPEFNVRIHDADYEDHIEKVCDSILANGFYQNFPLSVYAMKEGDETIILLVGGFTRLEAAKRANKKGAAIEKLPVVFKPPGTTTAEIQLSLANDNTGRPLKPYERAVVVKRLQGYGWGQKEISFKMGISLQNISDLLFLLSLPRSILDMVTQGDVSASLAILTARQKGPAETLEIFTAELAKVTVGEQLTSDSPEAKALETGSGVGRIRPKATGVISKATAFAAIDYAIALPGDGIEFLVRWRKNEADAVAEVAATLKKPKKEKAVKVKKTRKTKAEKAFDRATAASIGAEADRQEHDGL